MKEIMAVTIAVFVVIGGITALVFYANSMDLAVSRAFDPKREEVRRQTFEESGAYLQGMVQDIESMQAEYIKASPEHKDAIASIVLHRAAGVKVENLPTHVQDFIGQIRRDRGLR